MHYVLHQTPRNGLGCHVHDPRFNLLRPCQRRQPERLNQPSNLSSEARFLSEQLVVDRRITRAAVFSADNPDASAIRHASFEPLNEFPMPLSEFE